MGKVDFTPQQKIIIEAFKKELQFVNFFYFTGGTALSVFYFRICEYPAAPSAGMKQMRKDDRTRAPETPSLRARGGRHLGHRQSEDLDFFGEESFDTRWVIDIVGKWSGVYNFSMDVSQVEKVLSFAVKFEDGGKTRIDFNYYPYRRLKTSEVIDGLMVDSLADIAANKLLLVNQRMSVKDFVDLYFRIREYPDAPSSGMKRRRKDDRTRVQETPSLRARGGRHFLLNLEPHEFSFWDLMDGVKRKFGFELDPILVAADFMKVEEFDFLPRMIRPLDIFDLQEYFRRKAKEVMAGLTE